MMDDALGVPPHIHDLISEVQGEEETERVLLRHSGRLSTDLTLDLCYRSFGFSPSSCKFKRPLNRARVLSKLKSEYAVQAYLPELENEGSSWHNDIDLRSDLLRTFYDNHIDRISSPDQLGLLSFDLLESDLGLAIEDNSLSTMWSVPDTLGTVEPKSPASPEAKSPTKGYRFENSSGRKSKGLRCISVKVRDIVNQKKSTTYKEVADLLLKELEHELCLAEDKEQFKEEKNVRRRVYDALNVLVAAGVVTKSGKYVHWKSSSVPLKPVNRVSKKGIAKSNADKRNLLKQLINKAAHLEALFARNKANPISSGILRLPFITLVLSNPDLSSVRPKQLCIKTNAVNTEAELRMENSFKMIGDLDVIVRMALPVNLANLPGIGAMSKLCKLALC